MQPRLIEHKKIGTYTCLHCQVDQYEKWKKTGVPSWFLNLDTPVCASNCGFKFCFSWSTLSLPFLINCPLSIGRFGQICTQETINEPQTIWFMISLLYSLESVAFSCLHFAYKFSWGIEIFCPVAQDALNSVLLNQIFPHFLIQSTSLRRFKVYLCGKWVVRSRPTHDWISPQVPAWSPTPPRLFESLSPCNCITYSCYCASWVM